MLTSVTSKTFDNLCSNKNKSSQILYATELNRFVEDRRLKQQSNSFSRKKYISSLSWNHSEQK